MVGCFDIFDLALSFLIGSGECVEFFGDGVLFPKRSRYVDIVLHPPRGGIGSTFFPIYGIVFSATGVTAGDS